MEVKERKGKLIQKLIFAAVAAIVVVATALTVLGGIEINKTYKNMVQEELKVAVSQLDSEMNNVWDGPWSYVDGVVYKGEEDVMAEYEELMDEMKAATGVEYSLFYGKERAITTMVDSSGKKATGYNISDTVFSHVVTGKQDYYVQTTPAGAAEPYYCYYMPLKNTDGSAIGMVFAGRESDSVKAKVWGIIANMIFISVVITIVVSIFGIVIANKSSGKMRAIADELASLSRGELKLDIDQSAIDRNDEIGLLADGTKILSEKLGEVIKTTMDMSKELKESGSELSNSAHQASHASSQVSQAVDEISKGAVMQAESVENAAGNTQHIGSDIEIVADNVQQLNGFTAQMKESCEAAMEALNRLIQQSSEVQASVRDIGQTIDSTNESAKEISKFSQAITEIASQTNLLSLNASIEAARAGDAGKGFAVVATEIGQLAVQSSNSAEEIKKIVDKLMADSEASVEVMERLNTSFDQQEQQLGDTKDNMQCMAENVSHVSDSTGSIASHVDQLSVAKDKLVEIISDLSAISQENAASSEETNASMQELNATFAIISESAGKLQDLATGMTDAISYFKP
ncbi:methyl-accepting chemotaxis protein [Butyrivibrio sp. MC2021]|uniref:methyl-accepting chemotaxis protein n=1 Tax=Butyrivibrio sp. MC2021 TaxID=1408306 RepID=UPI0005600686|nr:methyl-accepting chemotaxis protein [Butyrivibrio sp. MC2021]